MRVNSINTFKAYNQISFKKNNKESANNTKTVPTTVSADDTSFKSTTKTIGYLSDRELDAYIAERIWTI